jgi:hypothetical protein
MTLKQFIYILILLTLLHSCYEKHDPDKYFGVQITNNLPFGSRYTDTTGIKYAYRSMLFYFTNDTLIPVNLQIEFPDTFISLNPSADSKYKVFLLPDSMTREKQYGFAINNGQVSKELEQLLSKELFANKLTKNGIQPGETYILRLGFLFTYEGVTRAEIFSKGHKHNLPIPRNEIKIADSNKKGIDLMLGVVLYAPERFGTDTSDRYSVINCGRLFYDN